MVLDEKAPKTVIFGFLSDNTFFAALPEEWEGPW